jgi:hypothetical protein
MHCEQLQRSFTQPCAGMPGALFLRAGCSQNLVHGYALANLLNDSKFA